MRDGGRTRRPPKADARPDQLRAKSLVLTEGTDEERLVFHLLRQRHPGTSVFGESIPGIRGLQGLDELKSGDLDVQIVDAHGRDQLSDVATWLPVVPGFGSVERLTILWDAEESATDALANVANAIGAMGFPKPEQAWVEAVVNAKTSVAGILPYGFESGCLESLVIEVLRSDHTGDVRFTCVISFLECLNIATDTNAKRDKRVVNAWLMGHRDPGIRLGAAFERDFPLDDSRFDPIVSAILGNDEPYPD